MGNNVTIPLKTPIRGPNNAVYNEIVLREPTFDETLQFDDPYIVAASPNGMPFVVENSEVGRKLSRYGDRIRAGVAAIVASEAAPRSAQG